MGSWRFFKRIPVIPGLRLNLSKSGVSVSLGRKGAWTTFSRGGRRTTVGAPGSGVYYTDYERWPGSGRPPDEPE
jgi:uncharacterized protein DUF4236